jgi:hypothetical protein
MIYGLLSSQMAVQALKYGLCIDTALAFAVYGGFVGYLSFDDLPLFDTVCRVFLRIMDERFVIPTPLAIFSLLLVTLFWLSNC